MTLVSTKSSLESVSLVGTETSPISQPIKTPIVTQPRVYLQPQNTVTAPSISDNQNDNYSTMIIKNGQEVNASENLSAFIPVSVSDTENEQETKKRNYLPYLFALIGAWWLWKKYL